MRRGSLIGLVVVVALAGVSFLFSGPAEGLVLQGHFTDDNGHLFEREIDSIAEEGITKGCNPPTNDHYCPDLDVDRGAMAAFLRRALNLPAVNTDHFIDDDNSIFESDINALAAAGITRGCNPPTNNRYCPNEPVKRGAMAAFLRRALDLPPAGQDYFVDDDNSIFQSDINAIAEAGITRGCNPPTNNLYCIDDTVDRGAMAAFLTRALGLPPVVLQIPMGDPSVLSCDKDGARCNLTVDLVPGRSYRVEEGVFQVVPASTQETNQFNAANTNFTLTRDGTNVVLTELPTITGGGMWTKNWRTDLTFEAGNHTLVGQWRWAGSVIQTTTVTVRANG